MRHHLHLHSRAHRRVQALLLFALLICGCDVPAQIVWSPDGTRAAYRSADRALLLDEKGDIVQRLGTSMGGFAWSADSRSLYFASISENSNGPSPVHQQWLGPQSDAANDTATQPTSQTVDNPTTEPATAGSAEQKSIAVVSVLRDGKTTPLFSLANIAIWYLQLSPDGQWLAAATSVDGNASNDEHRIYVFSIRNGRLYELSRFCGAGMCFTGADELAFIEANGIDDVGKMTGHIVKVKLDETSASLPRQHLLDVILPLTRWMEPCAGGVLFSASPRVFPGPATAEGNAPASKLYHFTCADGGLTVLADDVGDLFDASPDGKRIIFEKLTPSEPAATCPTVGPASSQATSKPAALHADLCVMNANGSDPHVLRSLDEYVGSPQPPMWPAWRGNDQITFIAPAHRARMVRVDDQDRNVFDVIQYQLTDKGTLKPIKTLSSEWKPEFKPYSQQDKSK